jgi:hypothetical protein
MGISDHVSDPIIGSVFPMKQVLASAAQAATLSLPNPICRHYILNRTAVHAPASSRVGHSFDLGTVTIAAPADWDSANESPDQKARRIAREQVLRWLDFSLRPPPAVTITHDANQPNPFAIAWSTRPRLTYQLTKNTTLSGDWEAVGSWSNGTGNPFTNLVPNENRAFFKVAYQAQEAAVNEEANEGFFLSYDDFGL